MRKVFTFAITATLACSLVLAQSSPTAEVEFKAARHKEEVVGDFKGALDQYKKIANGKDRAFAARALLRMASLYEKMGETEAQKVYERVVREYPEQKDAVAMARARLESAAVPASQFGLKQVWTGPRVDFSGSLTPDGRYLSFIDWAAGELYLRDFVTGNDRRVANPATNPGFAYGDSSVVSPDGKRVAYAWWDRTGLARSSLIDLSGSTRDLISPFNPEIDYIGPYDWSRDGKWIAVLIQRAGKSKQIGLVNPDNGSLQVLKSVDWRHPSRAFFSPDSKYLAFDLPPNGDADQRDVFVLAIDGSRQIEAVVDPAMDTVVGWAPDGKHLLFASDRTGSNGLWALPFGDGNPKGSPPQLIRLNIGKARPIGVSNDGTLYFGLRASIASVFVASVDFDSGKVLTAPVAVSGNIIGNNREPNWSFDGKYLAFHSSGPIVVILAVETGEVRKLRPRLDYFRSPRWSPDSKSLLVQGTDIKGRQGVFRIDAESGDTEIIVPGAFSPLWGADGTIFYRNNGLVERDLATGTERIALPNVGNTSGSLSPDGRYYTYIGTDPDTKQSFLTVVLLSGGEPRKLHRLESPGDSAWTTWTSDGRAILFGFRTAREIRIIPVTGGQVRHLDLGVPEVQDLRVQPNGNKVAFWSNNSPSTNSEEGVWIMENFLPVRKD